MTENNRDFPRLDTPLLTPAEAAQLLAVRPSWIYEAVGAGTLSRACAWGAISGSPGRCSRNGCREGWRNLRSHRRSTG